MAKTLLGLVGSPRKFGNSELFLKELYRQLPGEWELELMRLPDLDLRPCRACYQCLFGDMRCPQTDDFAPALERLADADAYAVAAPAYLLGANASLKRFLDRGLSFYGALDKLWGKPGVGVAIAGIEGMEGSTKLNVESFIKLTLGDLRGSAVLYGALPGEIFLHKEGKETARRLAEALTDPQRRTFPPRGVPVCSVCGGDTLRFLGDGQVRCMLCSSTGECVTGTEGLRIETKPSDHPFFLTYEEARQHAQWLRGMKEQFLARRKELKEVTRDYTQLGNWFEPGAAGKQGEPE